MQYAALKLFVDVAELGSLTKTALLYGTTQPHISRQISELEKECGGRLFLRTGRGVQLTELGERVMPRIRTWLLETDQLHNDIKTASGTPIGVVRIGILPSTAHPLASTLYQRVKETLPLVKLMIREGQGAQLETWLDNGSVDMALLFRHHSQPRDGEKYLIKTKTYLIGPAGDKITSKATVPFSVLHNLPLVLFCRPSSWRDQLDELSRKKGISLNIAMEADSLTLQMEIVANGGCYTLLGPYAIADSVKAGRIQASQIVDPEITRYIALATSKNAALTLAYRAVMQLVQTILKELNG